MNDRNPVTIALLRAGSRGKLNLGYLLKRLSGMSETINVDTFRRGATKGAARLAGLP